MTIQIDTREKAKAIKNIIETFNNNNIDYYSSKLYVGDYMSLDNPRVVIDRKQSLNELCSNVCQQHERFRDELIRAQEHNVKIIILCEHSAKIKCLKDVQSWYNPRLKTSPKALKGFQLYKILQTISEKYNVEFQFCEKSETGNKIIELLK